MADEYIKKATVLGIIGKHWRSKMYADDAIQAALDEIGNHVPSADVAPVRHGRWNEESPDCLDGDSVYVCSVCGETWTLIEGTPLDNNMHYCPNCGAAMDKEG